MLTKMKIMLHLRFNFITDSSGDPARMTRPEVNTNGEPVSMISTRSYSMIGEVIYLSIMSYINIFT